MDHKDQDKKENKIDDGKTGEKIFGVHDQATNPGDLISKNDARIKKVEKEDSNGNNKTQKEDIEKKDKEIKEKYSMEDDNDYE